MILFVLFMNRIFTESIAIQSACNPPDWDLFTSAFVSTLTYAFHVFRGNLQMPFIHWFLERSLCVAVSLDEIVCNRNVELFNSIYLRVFGHIKRYLWFVVMIHQPCLNHTNKWAGDISIINSHLSKIVGSVCCCR